MTFVISQKKEHLQVEANFGSKIQRLADRCSGGVAIMFWGVSVVVSQESKQSLLAQMLQVHHLCWHRSAYLRGWYKRKRRWYQGQKTEAVLSELETIQGAINTVTWSHVTILHSKTQYIYNKARQWPRMCSNVHSTVQKKQMNVY